MSMIAPYKFLSNRLTKVFTKAFFLIRNQACIVKDSMRFMPTFFEQLILNHRGKKAVCMSRSEKRNKPWRDDNT